MVYCCLGSEVSYSGLDLVGYWGLFGWDGFSMQTPIPMEQVEQGQGLEQLAPVVHSRLGWVPVPQMWAFILRIDVSAKLMHGPTTVV